MTETGPMMLVDLRIGFEKPGNNAISRMIAGYDSPGLFSHAALIFGKDLVLESHADIGGVRFRKYVPDPERWVFARPRLIAGECEIIREFGELTAGAEYDLGGVFAIAHVPLAKQDDRKFFCSEHVVMGMQTVGIFADLTPHLVSPNGLYLACERAGFILN